MKKNIIPAIRLTIVCIFVFMVAYPALIWGLAQFTNNKGEGETVIVNNSVVGYTLEGQRFTDDKYFHGRPSAVNYNAAGSGGSNKGASNPDYLHEVKDRIDTLIAHNSGIKKEDIPSDLVTASGSGLDPDISLQAANIQAARIAATRNIPLEKILALIQSNIDESINGIQRINVLQLNIALDKLN